MVGQSQQLNLIHSAADLPPGPLPTLHLEYSGFVNNFYHHRKPGISSSTAKAAEVAVGPSPRRTEMDPATGEGPRSLHSSSESILGETQASQSEPSETASAGLSTTDLSPTATEPQITPASSGSPYDELINRVKPECEDDEKDFLQSVVDLGECLRTYPAPKPVSPRFNPISNSDPVLTDTRTNYKQQETLQMITHTSMSAKPSSTSSKATCTCQ